MLIPVRYALIVLALLNVCCQSPSSTPKTPEHRCPPGEIAKGMPFDKARQMLEARGLIAKEQDMAIVRQDKAEFHLFEIETEEPDSLFLDVTDENGKPGVIREMWWWIDSKTDGALPKGLRNYDWQHIDDISINEIARRLLPAPMSVLPAEWSTSKEPVISLLLREDLPGRLGLAVGGPNFPTDLYSTTRPVLLGSRGGGACPRNGRSFPELNLTCQARGSDQERTYFRLVRDNDFPKCRQIRVNSSVIWQYKTDNATSSWILVDLNGRKVIEPETPLPPGRYALTFVHPDDADDIPR